MRDGLHDLFFKRAIGLTDLVAAVSFRNSKTTLAFIQWDCGFDLKSTLPEEGLGVLPHAGLLQDRYHLAPV